MAAETKALEIKLQEAIQRIERLEKQQEQAVPPWRFLVARSHPWRKQLEVKGRNITVGQLVATMRANELSPEQACQDLELPLEAIEEALAYERENRALIDMEFCEERRHLTERGLSLERAALPEALAKKPNA